MFRNLFIAVVACAALSVPASAQFSLLGLKNELIDFALEQISVPGELEIVAERVEDAEDGALDIVGLSVSDGDGVWMTVDRLSLAWTASRILRGELAIERLAATGVAVSRAPSSTAAAVEVREGSALSQTDDDPFDWPRAPIATRIGALALSDVVADVGDEGDPRASGDAGTQVQRESTLGVQDRRDGLTLRD